MDQYIQAATATPSSSPSAPEPMSVTPGLLGFFVIFTIAVVFLLLMVDMTRRLRRMRYRAEVAERTGAPTTAGDHRA